MALSADVFVRFPSRIAMADHLRDISYGNISTHDLKAALVVGCFSSDRLLATNDSVNSDKFAK
jgi:hypothetical protein